MRSFFLLKACLLIVLPGLLCCSFTAYGQQVSLNVLSYNIRLATPDDAPNTWEHRRENVFSNVRHADPDVFGLQEALYVQVMDFEKAFPRYNRVGAGRDDGKEAGEFSPLFYNSLKYSLLTSGTFWLSQTPAVAGSRGWDAACNRVVTWLQLKANNSEITFFVFCTHFDHMGEIARRNSARLILQAVDSLAAGKPVIILGDFNATPDTEPFQIITATSDPNHLIDARAISENSMGPDYTFTGFKVGDSKGNRIDYIFLKGIHKVVLFTTNPSNNGEYYPSDHLPVSATLELN